MHITDVSVELLRVTVQHAYIAAGRQVDANWHVLARVTTADGQTGWGEATPDPNVTGETYHSTIAVLEHDLGPAVIGLDAAGR